MNNKCLFRGIWKLVHAIVGATLVTAYWHGLLAHPVFAQGAKEGSCPPKQHSPRRNESRQDSQVAISVSFSSLYADTRKVILTEKDLRRLAKLREVERIDFGWCKVSPEGLRHLSGLKHLRSLNLRGSGIGDAGAMYLAKCTSLRDLDIGQVITVVPSDYTTRPAITDRGVKYLSRITTLERLSLYGTRVSDEGLAILRDLGSLHELDISASQVSGKGLKHLEKLPHLAALNVSNLKISKGLSSIGRMPNIKDLNLSSTDVDGDGLRHLASLEKLGKLDLSDTAVDDNGMVHVAKLTRLNELSLYQTKVTDVGLRHLVGLKDIQVLDIRYTALSDKGMADLARMRSLRELRLYGCTGISDGAIERLRKALPACEVVTRY